MATQKAPKDPPAPLGQSPRIHIVKEWSTFPTEEKTLADRVNDYLGDRANGDPRVVAVYPVKVDGPLYKKENRVLVVIERDERRGKKRGPSTVDARIRRNIERRHAGNGHTTPADRRARPGRKPASSSRE